MVDYKPVQSSRPPPGGPVPAHQSHKAFGLTWPPPSPHRWKSDSKPSNRRPLAPDCPQRPRQGSAGHALLQRSGRSPALDPSQKWAGIRWRPKHPIGLKCLRPCKSGVRSGGMPTRPGQSHGRSNFPQASLHPLLWSLPGSAVAQSQRMYMCQFLMNPDSRILSSNDPHSKYRPVHPRLTCSLGALRFPYIIFQTPLTLINSDLA